MTLLRNLLGVLFLIGMCLPPLVAGEIGKKGIQVTEISNLQIAGPVLMCMKLPATMAGGGKFRFMSSGEVGQGINIIETNAEDPFTIAVDSDFSRAEEWEKGIVCTAITGTAKFEFKNPDNPDVKIFIPSATSDNEFPNATLGPVHVPYVDSPNIPAEDLKKYLGSDDWYTRAAAAWLIAVLRYSELADRLLAAIKLETNSYSASYEALAILAVGNLPQIDALHQWLEIDSQPEDSNKLRKRVKRAVENPNQPIPSSW